MLDTKRFGMLAALLFLVVGIVGVVSLFGAGTDSSVTGATFVEISSISNCYDLDGLNEFIASEVQLEFENGVKENHADICESETILIEYVCGEVGAESERIICENACDSGACVYLT